MVAIPTGLAINSPVPADRTTASGFRHILATLFVQSAPGVPVEGIIAAPGTPLDVLPDAAEMKYLVKAGYSVTTRSGQGAYVVGTDVDVEVPTAAADISNPRIDRIYIIQPDPELTEDGVARIDVVNGDPSAVPALPALPTGALELGRKTVPAGASNTTTGSAISNKAPTTSVAVTWESIPGKPATFPPSAHTHAWSEITGKPTTFAPSAHTHAAADITSGVFSTARIPVIPVTLGGTGATTASAARTALGAAATAHTHAATDITSGTFDVARIPNLDAGKITSGSFSLARIPTITVANGGTGSTTAAGARTNLDAAASSHTHSASDINTGTLSDARIPNINAEKITAGSLSRPVVNGFGINEMAGLTLSGTINVGGGVNGSGAGRFGAAYNNNLDSVTRRAVWMSTNGTLGYTSSSRRNKQDIAPADFTVEQARQIELVMFRYKTAVEEHGDAAAIEYGVIAEQIDDLGLGFLVDRDPDGTVQGVYYERLALLALGLAQGLADRLDETEGALAALTDRVAALDGK